MTCLALQSPHQYKEARRQLRQLDLSFLPPSIVRLPVARRLYRGRGIGDIRKSWDVLWMLDRIGLQNTHARVLDVGAYRSEMMAALVRAGFDRSVGVDLAFPTGTGNPGASYARADMMQTPFVDGSFDHLTAVSVIEHGFDCQRLFAEVARLLKPGGTFLASFDFWPEKIDTSQTPLFGLPWNIFSAEEVSGLLDGARREGLVPTGAVDMHVGKPPIRFEGRRYTFGIFEVRKAA